MSERDRYDVLVFGSGTGGKVLAWTMAKEGKRTAVVERKYIGGSCPNVACLPSKNVFIQPKLPRCLAAIRNLGSILDRSRSTWPEFTRASARWSTRSSKSIWINITPPETS